MGPFKVLCAICDRRLGAGEEWAPGRKSKTYECMKCATEVPHVEVQPSIDHAEAKVGSI